MLIGAMNTSSENVTCSGFHQTIILTTSTLTLFLLSTLSLIATWVCLNLILKCRAGMLPHNVQYALFYCKIAYFIRSLNLFTKFAYEASLGVFGFSTMAASRLQCVLLDLTTLPSVLMPVVTYFAISIKLLKITFLAQNQLQWNQARHRTVAIANLLHWLLFLGLHFYFSGLTSKQSSYCFCYLIQIWPFIVCSITVFVLLFLCLLTGGLYYLVNFINKKRLKDFTNTARTNLNQRFVMWINVKIARWLLPIVSFQFFMYCLVMTFLKLGHYLHFGEKSFRSQAYTEYISAVFCIVSIETLVTPLMILRNKNLVKLAAEHYPKLWSCKWTRFLLFGRLNRISSCNSTCSTRSLNGNSTLGQNVEKIRKICINRQRRGTGVADPEVHDNGNVVEYRVRPDEHGAILENTWRNSLPTTRNK